MEAQAPEQQKLLPTDTSGAPQVARRKHASLCIFLSLAVVSFFALSYPWVYCNKNPILRNPNSRASFEETWGSARKLKTLKKPVVLLISADGFRYGYHWKVPLPNVDRLRLNGTEAVPGMSPVYPTLTFPNHYSIATGLFPAWHGIIANRFSDPSSDETFTTSSIDPKWWLGEPIWETVVKNGLVAATSFWAGSSVSKGAWNCTLPYCQMYNSSVPYEDRIATVLGFFDLPDDEMPSFIALYFEEPDHTGHTFGPDDPHMDAAITFVDQMLGKLFDGLDERGIFDDISIIFLSDHGMTSTCDSKVIYLEDFSPWVNISAEWADTLTPILALWPPEELNVKEVYQNMTDALSSDKFENSEFLKVYLKEDFPARFYYSSSDRVQPILGIVAEGYTLRVDRTPDKWCGGAHGYDNALLSMHPIFIAHGPQFAQGRKLPTFVNVEVYNLITTILGIQGAANNGSSSFPDTVLLSAMD